MTNILSTEDKNKIYINYIESPVGNIMLAAKDEKLIGAWIQGQKYFANKLGRDVTETDNCQVLEVAKDWFMEYFSGNKPDINRVPMAPNGSEFAKEVWQILKEIPYGEVITYGEIAKIMAKERGLAKMSAQAVGGAVGHNPLSIIVPCHRVVGTNGNLTGYAGGLEKKIQLLAHEGLDMGKFSMPK